MTREGGVAVRVNKGIFGGRVHPSPSALRMGLWKDYELRDIVDVVIPTCKDTLGPMGFSIPFAHNSRERVAKPVGRNRQLGRKQYQVPVCVGTGGGDLANAGTAT